MHSRGMPRTRRRAIRRLCAAGAGLATTLAVLPAALGVLPGTRAGAARADDRTISNNNLRDGWDQSESLLTPTTVTNGTFQALPGFPVQLSGEIYAQPLVVPLASGLHEVIVATENDNVYGINGATGHIDWSKSLGTPFNITTCDDLTPYIGNTGTPVYDPGTKKVYLVAQVTGGYKVFSVDPNNSGAVATIASIGGHPTNDSSISFSADQQLQRPGLLVTGGWVYAAFGSHCDHKPYVGFVAGVNLTTHATTLWSDETGLTYNQAGIWNSGGGMASDGTGRIFFSSGNGVSPAPGPGSKPPGQLAESIVRLAPNSVGTLSAKDFFSPANAPTLDASDADWGSGGPMALPFGTSVFPHLVVQAGKDGRVFVLNRDQLGGREQAPNMTDASLAKAGPYGGQWGHPAAFGDTTLARGTSDNDYMYYIGNGDNLRVLRFGARSGSGKPTVTDIANSSSTFGFGSAGPVVTSNGDNPSTAVVWTVNQSNGAGTLRAYPATPSAAGWPSGCTSGCALQPLFSASTGTAAKFTTPATSGNAVYVGTLSGALYGFGTPGAGAATLNGAGATPLSGPSVTFPPTYVGSNSTRGVSVTAHGTVTVTGANAVTTSSNGTSTPAQFVANPSQLTKTTRGSGTPVPVTLPVTLHNGDKLTAPVTFTPTSPGGVTGTLSFATRTATQPSAYVPLSGNGIRAGLYSKSRSVRFALVGDLGQFESWVPVGISVQRQIVFANGGATPETITTENLPSAPFSVTGLPPRGTTLKPGQSLVVAVSFTPVLANRTYHDTLTLGTSQGSAVVRLISRSLAPDSLLRASPSSVNFGNVRLGKRRSFTFKVTNAGNEPATIDRTSTLKAPFHAVFKVPPHLPLNAGEDLRLPVTFRPTKKGNFGADYTLRWTDVLGAHTLTFRLRGTGTDGMRCSRRHRSRR